MAKMLLILYIYFTIWQNILVATPPLSPHFPLKSVTKGLMEKWKHCVFVNSKPLKYPVCPYSETFFNVFGLKRLTTRFF